MQEPFELTVPFKNEDRIFTAQFQKSGYSYRILVMVDGKEIFFEPDEERNFRAIMQDDAARSVNVDLIKAIVEVLEAELK